MIVLPIAASVAAGADLPIQRAFVVKLMKKQRHGGASPGLESRAQSAEERKARNRAMQADCSAWPAA